MTTTENLTDTEKEKLLDECEELSACMADHEAEYQACLDRRTANADRLEAAGVSWTAVSDRCGVVRQVIMRQVGKLREGGA